jgi:hypothetical protein
VRPMPGARRDASGRACSPTHRDPCCPARASSPSPLRRLTTPSRRTRTKRETPAPQPFFGCPITSRGLWVGSTARRAHVARARDALHVAVVPCTAGANSYLSTG